MKNEKNINDIEKIIKYKFIDKNLLMQSITHSSYNKVENYEKLEFLGDAVLQIVISRYLFDKHIYLNEGQMTVTRAYAVCGETLTEVGKKLGIDKHILIGNSGRRRKINKNDSIIADVFESIVGAMYLEKGMEFTGEFIISNLDKYISDYIKSGDNKDYKTKLQHITQAIFSVEPKYILKDQKGPDHDKTFLMHVTIKNSLFGKGKGKTKKKAEQSAAFSAIKRLRKKGIENEQ
ncbi:MAG: ribonuclease III [Clostridiales bacterium]|nr:ribonuclease III [Clostridiales bacterium]